jgi:hypothetical protein
MPQSGGPLAKKVFRRFFYAVINKFTLPERRLSRAYPQDVVDRLPLCNMLGSTSYL